jgi:hypothetical protein
MAELLASLVDLSGRRGQLDTPTAEVEIPARMAAAYAAQKNLQAAEQQHQRARRYYHQLMRQQREQLSSDDRGRMEYYLGLVVLTGEPESFTALLRKLELGQRYLLMAVESGAQPWSQKAGDALSERWQQVWAMLQAPALDKTLQKDGLAQSKVKQRQQLDMASDFYDLLLKFEEERIPGAQTTGSRTLIQMGRENRLRLEKFARGLNIGPERVRDKRVANRPLSQAVRIGAPEPKTEKTPTVPQEKEQKPDGSPGPVKAQKPAIGDDPNL